MGLLPKLGDAGPAGGSALHSVVSEVVEEDADSDAAGE
jgi:hypothetical protein